MILSASTNFGFLDISNLITFPEGANYVDNQAPNSSFRNQYSASIGLASPNASFVDQEETHHLTTPDTVGSGMVSDKIKNNLYVQGNFENYNYYHHVDDEVEYLNIKNLNDIKEIINSL